MTAINLWPLGVASQSIIAACNKCRNVQFASVNITQPHIQSANLSSSERSLERGSYGAIVTNVTNVTNVASCIAPNEMMP